MNFEINEQCARLESLLYTRPNDTLREEVGRALDSKWEGVQVWAGRVLASWGGRRSIDALEHWLRALLHKEAAWAVRGEAIRSLCRCYQERDIPWLLDLYFGAEDRLLRHEFSPFILELPESAVRDRIGVESRSSVEARREAAKTAQRCLDSYIQLRGPRSNKRLQPTKAHRGVVKKRASRPRPRG